MTQLRDATRPVGVSAGGLGLLLAWLGGVAIAKLTGATPVVIVLAAGFVMFLGALFDGWLTIIRPEVGEIVLPHSSEQGTPVPLSAEIRAPRPGFIEICSVGAEVAHGWTRSSDFSGDAVFVHRGPVDHLRVRIRSAGLLGLIWWGRRADVLIERHLVAPARQDRPIEIERAGTASDGDLTGAGGAISGAIDGVRPWQDGDSEKFVHWTSTLRAGELMVHDRRQNSDQQWVVRARSGTPDPDDEAGAARRAIEQGLHAGVSVLAAVDDAEPVGIGSIDDAVEWTALAPLGPAPTEQRSWRERFRRIEPDATATMSSRWWAAAATLISLWMLTGALSYSIFGHAIVALGVAAGAAVSARSLVTGEAPSTVVRTVVGLGALLGFAMVAAASGRLDGLLAVLRGPLPQVLLLLIVLHGFECRDRRTIRVGLGISAVVLMYASGLRVDGAIAWWLLAWAITFGIAMAKLAGPTRVLADRRPVGVEIPFRRWAVRTAGVGLATVATIAVLAVVPVPAGPSNLTLPTLIEDAEEVPSAGGIAGPDGSSRDADSASSQPDDRAPAGQAGGYTGFADTMDTSVRGDLSDEIVMRVRAPEPDYWRGQTFARFDGRRWYADEEVGVLQRGPTIDVPPSLGNFPLDDDVGVESFTQTYFLETDMPNVIFHASRPTQIIADTDVWTRPDGALRASTVLPEGSIYTVVSERARVDADQLRRQGLLGDRLNGLGRQLLDRYLDVPETTTPETIALADELAAGHESTYDVVRAYEAWMSDNVEYDLNAPLPDAGEDAVHDFLFDSQLGFCEQIASSLTIMLRTQGVPARLATGYVSGTRDQISGAFEVRASDAHAWVEVWFPGSGWQAFDPTAAVPLSADAEIESVGADLAAGIGDYIGDHPARVVLVLVGGLAALSVVRLGRIAAHRRRRGRWGSLQDRFAATAARRGASTVASNPVLAEAWTGADDEAVARLVAERLDRVVFDPSFADEDDVFTDTRKLVGTLRSNDR
jgi:transglutaminase-like putative cysteine protease